MNTLDILAYLYHIFYVGYFVDVYLTFLKILCI
jgi:hypothetical protein